MSDRQVVLGEVSKEEAKKAMTTGQPDIAIHESAIPQFTDSNRYSFKAKWAVVGEDLQVQFFLPKHAKLETPQQQEAWQDYWLKRFASKLDSVARRYFEAESPRLTAKYTEELASWWLRAQGFGTAVSPKELADGFLDQLDEELRKKDQGSN